MPRAIQPKAAKASKPVAAKPAAKPAVATPAAAPVAATPAKPAGHITRTAATIVRNATNFGGTLSDRDTAYIAFYAGFAKAGNGTVSIADIHASGRKPAYNGSAKPHDAGVINRLGKAGLLNRATDGLSFTFTDAGKRLGAYTSAK